MRWTWTNVLLARYILLDSSKRYWFYQYILQQQPRMILIWQYVLLPQGRAYWSLQYALQGDGATYWMKSIVLHIVLSKVWNIVVDSGDGVGDIRPQKLIRISSMSLLGKHRGQQLTYMASPLVSSALDWSVTLRIRGETDVGSVVLHLANTSPPPLVWKSG